MDDEIIQAYLWQDVVRLGFSPSGDKDKKRWLKMYGQSLKDFWEIDDYSYHPSLRNGAFTAELTAPIQINMLIDYSILDISNYTVRFLHISNTRDLMWTHDVDSAYFSFPEQYFLTNYKKRNPAIINMSMLDMERVIDALLLHPRVHQHIESPINHHEIRIGGGIHNPFLFLFHLRYQLCPDKTKRNEEKNRLIDLFKSAIKIKKNVTAHELFFSS